MRRLKVLFVCLGNSCRSQMAEGFARAYGGDVLESFSAGVAPASIVSPLTIQVMRERNIALAGHFPKSPEELGPQRFDLVVNMSGYPLPFPVPGTVREWNVRDPMGARESVYRDVAQQIETLVMQLILEVRAQDRPAPRPGR